MKYHDGPLNGLWQTRGKDACQEFFFANWFLCVQASVHGNRKHARTDGYGATQRIFIAPYDSKAGSYFGCTDKRTLVSRSRKAAGMSFVL